MSRYKLNPLEELQLEKKRQKEERAIAKQRNIQMLQYRSQGLCQHCGGELKGFLVKKCIKCGKLKDY